MEQIINESDSNEIKTAAAVMPFDASNIIETAPPTESAVMPEPVPAPEKRGRGRPKGSTKGGASASRKKPKAEQDIAQGIASAHLIVGALDVVRNAVSAGECPPAPEMRDATVQAWAEYLESNGWEVPPWVQVSVISVSYVAPAFTTDTGKGRVSGMWAKLKGWWVAHHG